ncbi:hypothetical protein CBOM_03132 [Ceraceosorus bombacis]|uniref:Uncharacterized protein n=1 Tax=Ceraceosorus bombacis TaxID=401625 RepID=A0A0P1BMI3_9BASI|nr:hypothetical protein CBOM_03132 [Ceraceosorus bombacis]
MAADAHAESLTALTNESGAQDARAEAPPLQSLFTLPFALRLQPLPHLYFTAKQSAAGGEDNSTLDADSSASDRSDASRDSGALKLKGCLETVPPHQLHVVSYLIANTNALQAVCSWSKLLALLADADDDPAFSNLRAFFDARFDREGHLIEDAPKSPRKAQSRRRSSATRAGEEHTARSVRFRVRLDLHSVALAPPPPVPRAFSKRHHPAPILNTQILASPVHSGRSAEDDLEEMISPKSHPWAGTSKDDVFGRARAGSSASSPDRGLHRVVSPESVRSRSSLARSVSSGQSPSSPRADRSIFGRKPTKSGRHGGREASAASQNSRMDSLGRFMSQEGAHSTATFESAHDGEITALSTSSGYDIERSKSPNGSMAGSTRSTSARKPSMISRMFDFGKGAKKSSGSEAASTHQGADASFGTTGLVPGDEGGPPTGVPQVSAKTRAESSASLTVPSASLGRGSRRRTATLASNESEEEAVDTADDDLVSMGSSAAARWQRRRPSAGSVLSNNPSGASGLAMAPDLQPLAEGTAWSQTRASSSGHIEEESSTRKWKAGEDFLSLLRDACEQVLNVKPCAGSPSVPKAAGKGKRKEGDSSSSSPTPFSSGAQTPVGPPPKPLDTDSWWLCGHTDPLSITLPCAFADALGWEGIMQLCYGEGSQAARDQDFRPLGLAAQMDTAQQNEKSKVQNWARDVASTGASPTEQEQQGIDSLVESALKRSEVVATTTAGATATEAELAASDARSDAADDASDIAPSESASAKAVRTGRGEEKGKGDTLLERLRKRLPTRSASTPGGPVQGSKDLIGPAHDLRRLQLDGYGRGRTWEDWLGLARSIAAWVEDYETDRVHSGLAREPVALQRSAGTAPVFQATADSGFHEPASNGHSAFGQGPAESMFLPECISQDALDPKFTFRRRAGVPPALTNAESGEEHMHYRWASSRLKSKHFASAITLGTASLVHMLSQVNAADWTHRSAWELDYLEACVFHAPLVAERFGPPGTSVIPAQLSFAPTSDEERERAKSCPYPSESGAWDPNQWRAWLSGLQPGNIIVPAVSWQAWWTLISVLNGADRSGRPFDLQVKAVDEPFSAVLPEVDSVFI